jgi:hypothetical protein
MIFVRFKFEFDFVIKFVTCNVGVPLYSYLWYYFPYKTIWRMIVCYSGPAPIHVQHMCRGIGPPKNESHKIFLYNSNISKLRDVKFNILQQTANVKF